ncbi:MAG: carbamoyltransferase [Deltaproteobacteria bacterium]|nr:carbamoyltransferase [Deltaproteobacteria bacterium]
MKILGVSAFYHDSAACLVIDGKIVAAAQEERFTRKKHDADWPEHAIASVLRIGGITAADLDLVVNYEKPFPKFIRLISSFLNEAPLGYRLFLYSMPMWVRAKLNIPGVVERELDYKGKVIFPEHHESHAASAFFPSPFDDAAFMTMDGIGEWTTTSWGVGEGNRIKILSDIRFPHSLGLLYSAFTAYCGFRVNSGEYKLMGLAPYGEPKYADVIRDKLIDIRDDGSFRINPEYFTYIVGLRMTGSKFNKLFGGPMRAPESQFEQRHMDIARSVQVVTEEVILKMAHHVHKETGKKNLCLAGGVALNCVANGRLLREGPFENIWIQPAAGDAGGALGAALYGWYQYLGNERQAATAAQPNTYLGPEDSNDEIRAFLESKSIPYHYIEDTDALIERTAQALVDEKVVGWHQGRMEFGPRALGGRSILGDPRSQSMQRTMNLKIKYRESFRPFAPSVLAENVSDWFEMDVESPYMLLVADVAKKHMRTLTDEEKSRTGLELLNTPRSSVPAITHVDGSARVQTVTREQNPRYYDLIKRFGEKTGVPVVVNTSFNVRGEPIVCTPEDSYRCFMRTEMDCLVLGNYFLVKEEQPPSTEKKDSWQKEFPPD